MNQNPRNSQQEAFTLVELLVVIAMIAILSSILFPVFARARERGKQAACLGNLRQLGAAAQIYADDHDGYLPKGHDVTIGQGPPSRPTGWVNAMMPVLSNPDVLVCPADGESGSKPPESEYKENDDDPEIEQPYTSYLMNGWFTDGVNGRRTSLHTLAHPSDTVLFAERDTKRLYELGWSNDDDYHPWEAAMYWSDNASLAITRHHGGADYVYADGHVQWHRFSDTYQTNGLDQHKP